MGPPRPRQSSVRPRLDSVQEALYQGQSIAVSGAGAERLLEVQHSRDGGQQKQRRARSDVGVRQPVVRPPVRQGVLQCTANPFAALADDLRDLGTWLASAMNCISRAVPAGLLA
jgi:hypothetical protein